MNLNRWTLIASLLAIFSHSLLLAQEASKKKPAKSDTPASDTTPAAEEKSAGEATEPADQRKSDGDKPKADSEAKPNEIDELVAQLDHERLTKRQQAQKKLLGMGKSAIPALAKAALSGKRETIEKSIDVLAKLAQSKDEDTKDAARVTLQMLSESEQPSTADRAKLALSSKEADGIKPFEGWDKPGNEFAGGGQRNRSVSVSSVNGVRSINVKEGGLETSIQELGGGKLFVSITGGEKPIELTARNLADLKKKQPEAAAIYEQYAGGKMPAGFNIPGMPFGKANGAFKGGNANVFGNGAAGNGNLGDANQMLIRQLEELQQRMADPAIQAMIGQQIETLKRQN